MKKIPFVTTNTNGRICEMDCTSHNVQKIEINTETREVSIYVDEVDTKSLKKEELKNKSASEVKKLVIDAGGKYTNKKEGIAFLEGL